MLARNLLGAVLLFQRSAYADVLHIPTLKSRALDQVQLDAGPSPTSLEALTSQHESR